METETQATPLLAGRYRLGGLLGRGGMAEVFDAVDERLARPVAVKILRPEMARRPEVRGRFESEARSAARLSHPNVVAVYDTGEEPDGTPFLVMERLPGETLADRMAAGPVDPHWVLRVAGDVLQALRAAHDAGVIHRDVKPGNILLNSDGCAKVADFGIAKSAETAGAGDLTATGMLLGTPAYLAPERLDGRPATAQSDLWSLGVVIYEALAGRKPFTGPTPVALAHAVQTAAPEPLAGLAPASPPSLVAAVERALARRPEDRFASALEMAVALGVDGGADATLVESGGTGRIIEGPLVGAVGAGLGGAVSAGGPIDADATSDATSVVAERPQPVAGAASALADRADRAGAALAGVFPGLARWPGRLVVGLVVAALVLLAVAALAFGGDGGGPGDSAEASPAQAALAAKLRQVGEQVRVGDGPSGPTLADGLDQLAQEVEGGGTGAARANELLRSISTWRAERTLLPTAAALATGVLAQVPGVDPALTVPPSTVAPPPTTAAPEPAPPGKKKRGKDDDD